MPAQLMARYEEARRDPDLLNLRDEVAMMDGLIDASLEQMEHGGAFNLFPELQKAWRQLLRLQANGKAAEGGVVLREIGTLIERGAEAAGVLQNVLRLTDQRRKLVDSEQKRSVAMQQMITSEEAMTFVSVVMGAVTAHVHDRATLDAISRDIERHALTKNAEPPRRQYIGIDDADEE